MSIQVGKRRYFSAPNSTFRDQRLSDRARGVLAYLLTHNEGWEVRIDDLKQQFNRGTKAIRSTMRELRKFGYVSLISIKDSQTGDWKGRRYVVNETPDPTLRGASGKGGLNLLRKLRNTKAGHGAARQFELASPIEKSKYPKTTAGNFCKAYCQFLKDENLTTKKPYKGKMITIEPPIRNWVVACEELLKNVNEDDFEEVLEWYCENFRHVKLWVYTSFARFCSNFSNIQKIMLRQQKRTFVAEEQDDKIQVIVDED